MPAIPLEWMDQKARQLSSSEPWTWALYGYELLAPRVNVKGRMALILLVAVLWAFLWLLWRAYIVIQTPNDDLVDKLGLDIPPEPLVTLEEIAQRQITISWKPADSSASTAAVQEHHIEVNGRIAGVTRKHETMAVVSQLMPGVLYDVRVFSVSPGRFQTASAFLRVRTSVDSAEGKPDEKEGNPVVKGFAPRGPPVPTLQPAPAMAREHSGGQPITRRGTGGRKTSPAGLLVGADTRAFDDDSSEDLAALSQQFQKVSQETDSIDLQTEEETKEFEAALKEREAKLAAVKQDMKERDEASGDLRKQVNRAEALNRSLQSEKIKKEKLLKDMENKRRRRKDEISKWEERAQSIAEEIEAINKQKEAIRRRTESEVEELKEKNAEEQREIQAIQEENTEKATQLKELQEERKRSAVEEETDESREADRLDQEREARHHHNIATLRQQYQMILQDVQRAQQEHILARQRLAMYDTARRAGAGAHGQYFEREYGFRDKTGRRMPHTSSHGSNVSSPRAAFVPEPYNSVNQAVTTSSPMNGRTAGHLFNLGNGTTFPINFPQINIPQPPDEEDEDLSLAAQMSPRAEILLPHDLLGDESADELHADDEDDGDEHSDDDGGDMSPFPTMPSSRPPPPPIGKDGSSPESTSSRSPSSPRSFASPREDMMHTGTNDEQPEQAEEKSGGGHKRLTSMSNLFSFNRQRGKTSADELPMLGSLKGAQSQSFPRKGEDLDATLKPQRRLSYGGTNWIFPGTQADNEIDKAKSVSTRRGFPGLLGRSSAASRNYDPFAPRTNSIDPGVRGGSSSPRPGSTYSFDKMPRPSMEDSFRAWAFDRPAARNSPLVPDWASAISRSHSRRPSVGYGSTTNLSLNVAEEGEFIEPRRESRPLQAPIGTRPTSSQQSQRPSTPKLNPNAPSFTTMFSFGKSRDKNKEKDKPKTRDGKPPDPQEHASTPESRKSRDGHSIITTSTYESHDSLERTPSAQGTASLESTPATRPTIFSKISRKASSNKFGSWKDKSSNLFSRKDAPPSGDVDEERSKTPEAGTGSTEQLGRSLESSSSTPVGEDKKGSRTSLASWSFMRKKNKPGWGMKEDLTASEISENSEFQVSESGEDGDGESVKMDGVKG